MLRIAECLLDGGVVDRELCTATVLPALPALFAHGHGDLELRAAVRLGGRDSALEDGIAQRGDQLVIVETAIGWQVVLDRLGWAC